MRDIKETELKWILGAGNSNANEPVATFSVENAKKLLSEHHEVVVGFLVTASFFALSYLAYQKIRAKVIPDH